jgi:hypothetical protein
VFQIPRATLRSALGCDIDAPFGALDANTAMVLRQIYAEASGQGQVVWNMGARANEAADEITDYSEKFCPVNRCYARSIGAGHEWHCFLYFDAHILTTA